MLSCGTSFWVALLCKFTVTCSVHVCLRTSHHFNVKIALNISGLGALHIGRDAL